METVRNMQPHIDTYTRHREFRNRKYRQHRPDPRNTDNIENIENSEKHTKHRNMENIENIENMTKKHRNIQKDVNNNKQYSTKDRPPPENNQEIK